MEGTGTHFEITDSTYLNITLDSSEQINLMLESIPEMIIMIIESAEGATSTDVTISGFEPNTTYYKYEDSHVNLVEFTTDGTGSYTYTQDLSKEHLVFIQTTPSTIYLTCDGWKEEDPEEGPDPGVGTWNPLTQTGTLTDDVWWKTIEIYCDGVTLDGDGHTIYLTPAHFGVNSASQIGITVKNIKVEGAVAGIALFKCSDSSITGNTLSNNYFGMHLSASENITVTRNTINSNNGGIYINFVSNDNTIVNNNFIENPTQTFITSDSLGNIFDLDKPTGGNYWSNWDTPDSDSDGFVDNPYVFLGGQDNLPYTTPNDWPEPSDDTTPPTITFTRTPEPNTNGWNNSNVTIHFECSDDRPGVICPEDVVVSTEGENQEVTGTATDAAGNSASVTASEINIDKTPPTIVGSRTPGPNANGWNNEDVTVHFECNDSTSTIESCTPDETITTEGENQSRTGTAKDTAGNTTTTTVDNINIDNTAPIITITTPGEGYPIYEVGTALNFEADASISGIENLTGELTNTDNVITNVESGDVPVPGVYTLVVTATDKAGNIAISEERQFVVYDPKGGFATGGGWFHPNAEESTLSPEGKVNFGFVAKYQKGKATGNLEFQYQDSSINLKSTEMDWIVISGTSAQFQGTATINGEGTYTFRVQVKDLGEPGAGLDEFDIRVWDSQGIEFKAKNVIEGGNIVIHSKGKK